jgi:hypothetical protein
MGEHGLDRSFSGQGKALVNVVINLWVPINAVNFLSN